MNTHAQAGRSRASRVKGGAAEGGVGVIWLGEDRRSAGGDAAL